MTSSIERDRKGRFVESKSKIRDRIAEKAMTALMQKYDWSAEKIAEEAFWIAGCMMRERESHLE